jgi:hypothetical protein
MLNPPADGPYVQRKQLEDERRILSAATPTGSGGDFSAANRDRSLSDIKRDFQLGDVVQFVNNGLRVSEN